MRGRALTSEAEAERIRKIGSTQRAAHPIDKRLEKLTRKDADGCWRFTGELRHGYGYIRNEGARRRAHRIAYELAHGPIPEGLVVKHSCDNRSCVNPEHLSVGTTAENNREIVERGRHGNQWRSQSVVAGDVAGVWAEVTA